MTYSSNYTNRTSIFDTGDVIEGDHVKSLYDELGQSPGNLLDNLSPYVSGWWVSSAGGANGSVTATAARMTLTPLVVAQSSASIDRAAVQIITTAGSAGSVIRLGIYGSSYGMPSGAPIADWGTVSGTSIAVPELSITTLSLTRGLYWLAAATQGAPATEPTVRYSTSSNWPLAIGNTATTGISAATGLYLSGVTGALPTITSVTGSIATPTLVAVRYV
jgi:hypothetical protein